MIKIEKSTRFITFHSYTTGREYRAEIHEDENGQRSPTIELSCCNWQHKPYSYDITEPNLEKALELAVEKWEVDFDIYYQEWKRKDALRKGKYATSLPVAEATA